MFVDKLFEGRSLVYPKQELSKSDLYKKIITGGYPSVQGVDVEVEEAWMRSYLNLILQRDIKDLAQIEKITELPNILKLMAHRASNLLNVAEISRDAKMVAQTVHRYIALLQTIFLINLQQPWHYNLSLRFIKSSKLYLVDSGLLAYLLGLNLARALDDNYQVGKALENFITSELRKQISWSKIRPEMYHFRTSSGEEVDVVLEDRSGSLVGIEVKNSKKVTPEDFKGLKYLQEKTKKKFLKGIVLYSGQQIIPFGEGLLAVPIHALWQN